MMERGKGGGKRVADRYYESCRDEFWQEVFRLEREYLVEHLAGCRDILSVGCGPAVIEGGLAERGFRVTGLDISREALRHAPEAVGVVAARAERMPFREGSFDAVIFVVSLQFIGDFRKAVENSALALRPTGRIIVMLLNPEAKDLRKRLQRPSSYFSRIRHRDLKLIEGVIAESFMTTAEYFLHLEGNGVTEGRGDPGAALFVVLGTKRVSAERPGSPMKIRGGATTPEEGR